MKGLLWDLPKLFCNEDIIQFECGFVTYKGRVISVDTKRLIVEWEDGDVESYSAGEHTSLINLTRIKPT